MAVFCFLFLFFGSHFVNRVQHRRVPLNLTYLELYAKAGVFLQLLVEALLVVLSQLKRELSPENGQRRQQQQAVQSQSQHGERKVTADRWESGLNSSAPRRCSCIPDVARARTTSGSLVFTFS